MEEKAKKTVSILSPKSCVFIDYPSEYEKINSCHYAVRIGASDDGYVEVSFNNDEWVPCRFNSGYWWFDWIDFNPGEYSVGKIGCPAGQYYFRGKTKEM